MYLLTLKHEAYFTYIDALWQESKHIFDPTTRILQDCYNSTGNLLGLPGSASRNAQAWLVGAISR